MINKELKFSFRVIILNPMNDLGRYTENIIVSILNEIDTASSIGK